MSFGFSVGDFIATGDKAWMIYKKCKYASSDHAELATSVDILHTVLLTVQEFGSNESIPADEHKVKALIRAREACESTLDEVEQFLKKFPRFKSSKRRFIDVAKFLFKDVETLKAKLFNSTNLLQLSLTSLTSLSVVNLQKTLEIILTEHREGTREPSVLSQAILDSQPAERDELLDQLRSDLEDKDIHPDSITLNEQCIVSWLSSVTADFELGESSQAHRKSLILYDDVSPSLQEALDIDSVLATGTSSIALASNTPSIRLVPFSTNAGDRGKSEAIQTERPASGSFHKGRHGDWNTYSAPDSEDVYSVMDDLFEKYPSDSLNIEETNHKISWIYQQQDWQGRGYLTRGEVVKLISKYLGQSPDKSDETKEMVRFCDSRKNGRLMKPDFLALMCQLLKTKSEHKTKEIKTLLQQLAEEYRNSPHTLTDFLSKDMFYATNDYVPKEEFTFEFLFITKENLLPWGWSLIKQLDGRDLYFDRIRRMSFHSRPDLHLSGSSFTAIALQAERCVDIITDIQGKWIWPVSTRQRSQYLQPLDQVRDIALNFTLLDHPNGPNEPCVMDAIAACLEILYLKEDSRLVGLHNDLRCKLKLMHTSCEGLCRLLQGFCQLLLASFGLPSDTPKPEQLIDFRGRWREKQIFAYANFIRSASDKLWTPTSQSITEFRQIQILRRVEPLAIDVARNWIKSKQPSLKSWCAKVHEVEVLLPEPIMKKILKTVALSICIDKTEGKSIDSQLLMTASVDDQELRSFGKYMIGPKELRSRCRFQMPLGCTIRISLVTYSDIEVDGAVDSFRTLCSVVTSDCAMKLISQDLLLNVNQEGELLESVIEEPFFARLVVDIEPAAVKFPRRSLRYEDVIWSDLLRDSQCYWGAEGYEFPNPGWELKVNADQIAYYEHRETKQTSFSRPQGTIQFQ